MLFRRVSEQISMSVFLSIQSDSAGEINEIYLAI